MADMTNSERKAQFQRAFERLKVAMAALAELDFTNLEMRRELWGEVKMSMSEIEALYPLQTDPLPPY
jgi:hypothetical protein